MSGHHGIATSVEGHVGILTLDRPPNNHLGLATLTAIGDALADFDDDPRVRAVVLRAEGRVFCAGADLTVADDDPVDATRQFYVQAARIFEGRKPIVTEIRGAAVGAGLGLALAADFRVVTRDARFVGNFVKLGFNPGFAITHTLPRLVGAQKAALILLTGRRIAGEEAVEIGLADTIVPSDAVRDAAFGLASEIAENAPLAVAATRGILRAGLIEAVRAATHREGELQAGLRTTLDFAEGVRAVGERRPGNFLGR